MNKKLIAMAVGSAIGTLGASAAFAQSSTVSLSGAINMNYGYFDNGGAPNGGATGTSKVRTDALSNQESEWVLKGEENVGGGMAAYFQCSTSWDLSGMAASNMCGRNSVIGLKSSMGSLDFGNFDTPAKRLASNFDPFPISAAMGQGQHLWNGAGGAGNGASATSAASFSRRQSNLITYNMPTMNGFDASFAFSSANEASSATSASTIQKPRLWSTFVSYTNGPLQLGAAFERHIDYNPGGALAAVTSTATKLGVTAVLGGAYAGGNDSMYTLGIGYTFMGSLRLSGVYNRINYNNITTPAQAVGNDLSVNTYGVYADWAITGPHRLRLGYSAQGSTRGTYTGGNVGFYVGNGGAGQTGVQKLHAEYAYALSKRTELGLAAARINNDLNAAVSVGAGAATPNAGESQSFFGALIRHKF